MEQWIEPTEADIAQRITEFENFSTWLEAKTRTYFITYFTHMAKIYHSPCLRNAHEVSCSTLKNYLWRGNHVVVTYTYMNAGQAEHYTATVPYATLVLPIEEIKNQAITICNERVAEILARESAQKLRNEEKAAKETEAQERAELARLKAKYEVV